MIFNLPQNLVDEANKILGGASQNTETPVAEPAAALDPDRPEMQRFKALYIAALKQFGISRVEELDDVKRTEFDSFMVGGLESEKMQLSTLMGGDSTGASESPIPWGLIYKPETFKEVKDDDDSDDDDDDGEEETAPAEKDNEKDSKEKLNVNVGGTYKYNSSSGVKSITIIKERVPEGGYVAKDNSTGKKIIISLDNQYKIKALNEVSLEERELTADETTKRDRFVKSLETKREEFVENYGEEKATEVIHATATKMAKGN